MRKLILCTLVLYGTPAGAAESVAFPISIPKECSHFAKRAGVPSILKNEAQAKHAYLAFGELDMNAADVKRCRSAIERVVTQLRS